MLLCFQVSKYILKKCKTLIYGCFAFGIEDIYNGNFAFIFKQYIHINSN